MANPTQRRDARLVVGSNIRRIRHELELTHEEVAEAAGLHPNYVGGVELGKRNVSILNIDRFAVALGVTMADLVAELPGAASTQSCRDAPHEAKQIGRIDQHSLSGPITATSCR